VKSEVEDAVALLHGDLEGASISPSVIPRVDVEPVSLTVLNTPSNALDGVTAKHLTGNVRVDTGLIGNEIFEDGEGKAGRTVSHNVELDIFNRPESVEVVDEVLV